MDITSSLHLVTDSMPPDIENVEKNVEIFESRNMTENETIVDHQTHADETNAQPEADQQEQQDEDKNDQQANQNGDQEVQNRKSVLFGNVTVYFFNRSQGFSSIPSKGGSTLGMTSKHFKRRNLTVDMFEEVRRRSRRQILMKIKLDKTRRKRSDDTSEEDIHCNSTSSSTSPTSNTTTSDSDETLDSDNDNDSLSDFSDMSDSELRSDFIFLQPMSVKLRRLLLRASGVGRIDPKEKKECKVIRESRERSGCKCINQCIPGLCECTKLGVNCHVDRVSFPCGCISGGCQNPLGRTEFDIKRVKGHRYEKLGIG